MNAQLPQLGVWSALAPPGWRVQGTLDAQATLSGTRSQPRWHGKLAADGFALRSVLDGVDLRDGRLRATLQGDRIAITSSKVRPQPLQMPSRASHSPRVPAPQVETSRDSHRDRLCACVSIFSPVESATLRASTSATDSGFIKTLPPQSASIRPPAISAAQFRSG